VVGADVRDPLEVKRQFRNCGKPIIQPNIFYNATPINTRIKRKAGITGFLSYFCPFLFSVQFLEEFVNVNAVGSAGFFDGLAACHYAAEAVHTELKKQRGFFRGNGKNISYKSILGYICHCYTS